MSRPILLVDVDGTLLDVRRKYWWAHCRLASLLGEACGNQERFWAGKRERLDLAQLLEGWNACSRLTYAAWWPGLIESRTATAFDTAVPGTRAALARLRREYDLVAITMRRSPDVLRESLRKLGLIESLDGLVVAGDSLLRPASKAELLARSGYRGQEICAVVGDSDDDVDMARRLAVPVVAVLSGLRSEGYLGRLQPDAIVDSIASVPFAIGPLVLPRAARQTSGIAGSEQCVPS